MERSLEYQLYYHCFLLLAMTFERWVAVCRSHDYHTMLSKKKRVLLYLLTLILPILMPQLHSEFNKICLVCEKTDPKSSRSENLSFLE